MEGKSSSQIEYSYHMGVRTLNARRMFKELPDASRKLKNMLYHNKGDQGHNSQHKFQALRWDMQLLISDPRSDDPRCRAGK